MELFHRVGLLGCIVRLCTDRVKTDETAASDFNRSVNRLPREDYQGGEINLKLAEIGLRSGAGSGSLGCRPVCWPAVGRNPWIGDTITIVRRIAIVLTVSALCLALWKAGPEFLGKAPVSPSKKSSPAVAVEAAQVVTGAISLRRTFSGTLEASEKFLVAPKVSGRVEFLAVDIGDRVRQGQVVARLDHDEFSQAVTQAQADLAVAQASETQAKSTLDIAARELRRIKTLRKRGVSSESQLDAAQSRQMAARAGLTIARAQVTRAGAALETARIRLGYTRVTADWAGEDEWRAVAENFVDQGDTVSANSPLISVVDLDPVTGVIFVTEKDYGRLRTGQQADLTTDAYPGRTFSGRVARISPVFRETTRQARVELSVDNPDQDLKPGMFVRISLVLASVPDAVIVPESALARRGGNIGVFLIDDGNGDETREANRKETRTVTWQEVVPGIQEQDRVQVSGVQPGGRVVTLGQQMLDNGSKIIIPEGGQATMNLPGFSVRRPVFTTMITLIVVVVGSCGLKPSSRLICCRMWRCPRFPSARSMKGQAPRSWSVWSPGSLRKSWPRCRGCRT